MECALPMVRVTLQALDLLKGYVTTLCHGRSSYETRGGVALVQRTAQIWIVLRVTQPCETDLLCLGRRARLPASTGMVEPALGAFKRAAWESSEQLCGSLLVDEICAYAGT